MIRGVNKNKISIGDLVGIYISGINDDYYEDVGLVLSKEPLTVCHLATKRNIKPIVFEDISCTAIFLLG
jgi:hypothetical protein